MKKRIIKLIIFSLISFGLLFYFIFKQNDSALIVMGILFALGAVNNALRIRMHVKRIRFKKEMEEFTNSPPK